MMRIGVIVWLSENVQSMRPVECSFNLIKKLLHKCGTSTEYEMKLEQIMQMCETLINNQNPKVRIVTTASIRKFVT